MIILPCSVKYLPRVWIRIVKPMLTSPLRDFVTTSAARGVSTENVGKVIPLRLRIGFVSCGGNGKPSAVLLETKSNSTKSRQALLFNCGEEVLTRSAWNKKVVDVENVFVTHHSWSNIGGLGTFLRKRFTEKRRGCTLHGPPMLMKHHLASVEEAEVPILDVLSPPEHVHFHTPDLRIDYIPLFTDAEKHNTPTYRTCSVAFLIKNQTSENEISLGKDILILEIPDHTYLDSLLSSPDLQKHCPDVRVVIHMSKQKILDDERYNVFLNRFSKESYHFVLNEICDIGGSVYYEHLSHYLDDRLFPPLCSPPANQDTGQPTPGKLYKVSPDSYIEISESITLGYKTRDGNSYELQSTEAAKFHGKKLKQSLDTARDTDEQFPEIHFLGTGGSYVNPYRGQPGIYIHVSEDCALLLDCGEGTLNRLKEYYGGQVDEILAKIKFVFISHLHMDHYHGLFGVVEARYWALKQMGRTPDPLPIFSPTNLVYKLDFFCNIWPSYVENIVHFTPNKFASNAKNIQHRLCENLNLKKLRPFRVFHTEESFGIVLNGNDGWKIVYSGDTAPCDNFVLYGKDCDLLIHEATYIDDRYSIAMAEKHNHSTISQAVNTGRKMKAKNIILTHFGRIQSKVPHITEEMLQWSDVGLAFDNMRVRLADLPCLHLAMPVVKTLFHSDINEIDRVKDRSKSSRKIHGISRQTVPVDKG